MPPHSAHSGFAYTNLDPGAKALRVQLIGERNTQHLEFLLPVPGFEADFDRVKIEGHYRPEEMRDLGLDSLRTYLLSLPCCGPGVTAKRLATR